jgi:hypothetical protein
MYVFFCGCVLCVEIVRVVEKMTGCKKTYLLLCLYSLIYVAQPRQTLFTSPPTRSDAYSPRSSLVSLLTRASRTRLVLAATRHEAGRTEAAAKIRISCLRKSERFASFGLASPWGSPRRAQTSPATCSSPPKSRPSGCGLSMMLLIAVGF